MLFSFLGNILREGTRESFGRVVSLPFLLSAWALLSVGGAIEIWVGHSAPLDTAGTLALIGFALYTGSKFLSLRGPSGQIQSGPGDQTDEGAMMRAVPAAKAVAAPAEAEPAAS